MIDKFYIIIVLLINENTIKYLLVEFVDLLIKL